MPTDQPRDESPRVAQPADKHAGQQTIHLDQFLKAQGLVDTGGQAKVVIQGGEVLVNGEVDTRRRRQLRAGDVVQMGHVELPVEFD